MYMMAKVVPQIFWCKGCPQRGHKSINPLGAGGKFRGGKKCLKKQEKQISDFFQWKLNAACLKSALSPYTSNREVHLHLSPQKPWLSRLCSQQWVACTGNEWGLPLLQTIVAFHILLCFSHLECWQPPGYSQPYQQQQLWTEINWVLGWIVLDTLGVPTVTVCPP